MASRSRKRGLWRILALTLVGLTAAHAAGNNYGCRKGVVTIGDPTFTIIEKCGQPRQKEALAGGGADATEEHWYYGTPGKLPYLFHLRAGRLISIQRLKR